MKNKSTGKAQIESTCEQLRCYLASLSGKTFGGISCYLVAIFIQWRKIA